MYRYWVISAKVPVNKVIPVSKYLSRFKWFAGSKVEDDNFPRGLATIYLRLLHSVLHPTGHFELWVPILLFFRIHEAGS